MVFLREAWSSKNKIVFSPDVQVSWEDLWVQSICDRARQADLLPPDGHGQETGLWVNCLLLFLSQYTNHVKAAVLQMLKKDEQKNSKYWSSYVQWRNL